MKGVVEEVREDITREFSVMAERFGLNNSMMRIYMCLFFSTKPLSMEDIVGETGYSKSTVCNMMALIERLTDVRRFQKPGSKKVYFECLHDMKLIQRNKMEEFAKSIKSVTKTLEESDRKLAAENGRDAQLIRKHLAEWRGAVGKFNMVAGFMEKIMELKK